MQLCSKLFVIGTSALSIVIHNICRAINVIHRHEITWPTVTRLVQIQHDFKRLCGLLAVVGSIDKTHISIAKPRVGPEVYFYFKIQCYSIYCQVIVNNRRRFLDLFLTMPGLTNDTCVLHIPSLYHLA